jgi:uncharacterized protein (TIGR02597 family)
MQTARYARGLRFLPKVAFTITTVALISAAIGYQASAQSVYTQPVGFYQVAATNGSDTLVTLPFEQVPAFVGTVSAFSGSQLTVSGSPAWTPTTQWASPNAEGLMPYYVQITSGAKAGAVYTITNNDASSLYVQLAPEDLSTVAAGDYLQIVQFWTLGTALPASSGIVPSTSSLAAGRRTQVLFPNLAAVGINQAPATQFYYFNNAWRRSAPSAPATSNFNDVVIEPDQYVTVREATNVTDAVSLLTIGQVVTNLVRIPLNASAPPAVGQDNWLGIYRPSSATLASTGLSNAIVPSVSSLAAGRRDILEIFDNTSKALNKAPSQQFYYFNNGWRRSAPSAPATVDFSQTNVFLTAAGFIVRKSTNGIAGPTTTMWSEPPNY